MKKEPECKVCCDPNVGGIYENYIHHCAHGFLVFKWRKYKNVIATHPANLIPESFLNTDDKKHKSLVVT